MNASLFDITFKISSYIGIPIAIYFLISSFNIHSPTSIENEDVLDISFENQIINNSFDLLFNNSLAIESTPEKELLFKDLGAELSGIVSMKDQPEKGYIILNFLNKKVDKNIFKPGDKIDNNIFLESIHPNFIRVSINNKIFQIYLSDKKRATQVDGIINLDVSLLEILPYLKIEKGTVKSTQGIYISDRVNGKILRNYT